MDSPADTTDVDSDCDIVRPLGFEGEILDLEVGVLLGIFKNVSTLFNLFSLSHDRCQPPLSFERHM
jgi:hypothetical protein